jgi:hypothetical protein
MVIGTGSDGFCVEKNEHGYSIGRMFPGLFIFTELTWLDTGTLLSMGNNLVLDYVL